MEDGATLLVRFGRVLRISVLLSFIVGFEWGYRRPRRYG